MRREGYLAVAPALFDRVERGVELGYSPTTSRAGRAIREKVSLEQALADVEAAAKEVAGAGRIGVVGYCWGGTVAWVAATRSRDLRRGGQLLRRRRAGPRRRAAELPGPAALRRAGPRDPARGRREGCKAAHPELPVYIYPAGHGFNCDQRASYHAESARLARERTLAFLREHIAGLNPRP